MFGRKLRQLKYLFMGDWTNQDTRNIFAIIGYFFCLFLVVKVIVFFLALYFAAFPQVAN